MITMKIHRKFAKKVSRQKLPGHLLITPRCYQQRRVIPEIAVQFYGALPT